MQEAPSRGNEDGVPSAQNSEPNSNRKERNRKKRARKKKSRIAKRTRVEEEAGAEAEGWGEGDRLSSQVSSHMTYAGGAEHMARERADTGATTTTTTTMDMIYDYGVVKGKTKGKVFVHGNYDRYYGYRLPGAAKGRGDTNEDDTGVDNQDEDPRIRLLEKEWFHRKRCLDVGCNEGILTLNLVKKFKTATMTAIDLDEYLVKRACVNLRQARSAAAAEHVASQQGEHQQPRKRKLTKQTMKSLSKTWFVHGNVLASKVENGSFDCITALSVTKWIHLNGGDGGIRYFFSKVRDSLAPGGKFILEPQSWRSYKSAVAKVKRGGPGKVADTSYFNRLNELKIRPEDFVDILASEYGMQLMRSLGGGGQATGFDRNLYVFVKR